MSAQHAPRPRLLIPRPAGQAEAFAETVEAEFPGRFEIVAVPLMEIRFRDAPPDMAGVTDLVFSSANGVAGFLRLSAIRGLRAHCVGPATTGAALEAGFRAAMAGASAAELTARLSALPADPGRRFLHLRGAHAAADLAGALRAAGHDAAEAVIYDQVAVPLADEVVHGLRDGLFDTVMLFSPRSARLLAEAAGAAGIPRATRLLCISDAVARVFPGHACAVAARPDAAAMLALLAEARD
ncbi:uroporphyrinogen-III synthase [Halovulum dunhuangense]|uniref:Uroporphyrinogen-III synthase n=1 Tax=Halovulum dunhuangense TaxID=1505036 RepID=A0A849KUI1_9RHOB|nr:uroporphyrinogen-III synthase [Halovulum dunhuangense]NNU79261.1 uroporphyrinogen-III synthase [Halovulum dunhuangense]